MTFLCGHLRGVALRHAVIFAGSFLVLAAAAVLCADGTADDAETSGEPLAEGTNSTVITSDRLSYDAEKRVAVFEGNVVVKDPQMNMTANTLTILFSEDNSIESIQARGGVTISQDEISGTGEEAVYYLQEGKVVLTGKPKVTRKHDELSGETITFYRETGRMICEPNAILRLRSIPDLKDGDPRKERGI